MYSVLLIALIPTIYALNISTSPKSTTTAHVDDGIILIMESLENNRFVNLVLEQKDKTDQTVTVQVIVTPYKSTKATGSGYGCIFNVKPNREKVISIDRDIAATLECGFRENDKIMFFDMKFQEDNIPKEDLLHTLKAEKYALKEFQVSKMEAIDSHMLEKDLKTEILFDNNEHSGQAPEPQSVDETPNLSTPNSIVAGTGKAKTQETDLYIPKNSFFQRRRHLEPQDLQSSPEMYHEENDFEIDSIQDSYSGSNNITEQTFQSCEKLPSSQDNSFDSLPSNTDSVKQSSMSNSDHHVDQSPTFKCESDFSENNKNTTLVHENDSTLTPLSNKGLSSGSSYGRGSRSSSGRISGSGNGMLLGSAAGLGWLYHQPYRSGRYQKGNSSSTRQNSGPPKAGLNKMVLLSPLLLLI